MSATKMTTPATLPGGQDRGPGPAPNHPGTMPASVPLAMPAGGAPLGGGGPMNGNAFSAPPNAESFDKPSCAPGTNLGRK